MYQIAPHETNLISLATGTVWREVTAATFNTPRPESFDFLQNVLSPQKTVLEVLKGRAIPISLWILIGSIIGGLLLLALIIFILWKVSARGTSSGFKSQLVWAEPSWIIIYRHFARSSASSRASTEKMRTKTTERDTRWDPRRSKDRKKSSGGPS